MVRADAFWLALALSLPPMAVLARAVPPRRLAPFALVAGVAVVSTLVAEAYDRRYYARDPAWSAARAYQAAVHEVLDLRRPDEAEPGRRGGDPEGRVVAQRLPPVPGLVLPRRGGVQPRPADVVPARPAASRRSPRAGARRAAPGLGEPAGRPRDAGHPGRRAGAVARGPARVHARSRGRRRRGCARVPRPVAKAARPRLEPDRPVPRGLGPRHEARGRGTPVVVADDHRPRPGAGRRRLGRGRRMA